MSVDTDPSFPEIVPVLVDPARGVRLRAGAESDLPAMVEQCRDPASVRFTTVPNPYDLTDARSFLHDVIIPGWASGNRLLWVIELSAPRPIFAGTIDLRPAGDGTAEVGFGLHPAARGRGAMSTALRLVRDHSFDVRGLRLLRWRAAVGNWGSRRVAAAAGFRFDGRVRQLLNHRGELLDGWVATMTSGDPREPQTWLDPPRLAGDRVVLRPFAEPDLGRIAEACNDEATRHWLVSLPRPYTLRDADAFIEGTREMAAQRHGLGWCVADPVDDRCVGSVSLEGYANYALRGEIGYWAHPDSRGRRLIGEAVRLVSEYATGSGLVSFVQIRCAAGNLASRGVAEGAGYVQVGVLPRAEPLGDGSIDDLVIYVRGGIVP
jgi:[ribosomal protein S5]-alanine N-acetyltransferase